MIAMIDVGDMIRLSGSFTPAEGEEDMMVDRIEVRFKAPNGDDDIVEATPIEEDGFVSWTFKWTAPPEYVGSVDVVVQGWVGDDSVESVSDTIFVRGLDA